MVEYTRSHPSPRYLELLAQYRQLHQEGNPATGIEPAKMFPGHSLLPQVEYIKNMIDKTGARTLLDYGAGKGEQYRVGPVNAKGVSFPNVPAYWGVESVCCYDPGYAPHSTLPKGAFDGVICTDVLEHCPEEDIGWIVDGLFAYATRFVFGTAACFPAQKTLPNGENAHCTVRPAGWWAEKINVIAQRYPFILFRFHFLQSKAKAEGEPGMQFFTNESTWKSAA